MNDEKATSPNGLPELPPRMSDEEWEAHWARIEAETPRQLNEEEMEQMRDLDWAMADPEINRLYPDKVVAVYRRQVVAIGDYMNEVLKEAERVTGRPQNLIAAVPILGSKSLFANH